VPPENFIYADIRGDRLDVNQPPPVRPDKDWPDARAKSTGEGP
jgi:hypothetical protein